MERAPERCILCNIAPENAVWNSLEIRQCPSCGLAWRAEFDLPDDYYAHAGEAVHGYEKEVARERNARDRLRMLRRYLPRQGVCDIGCGDGAFVRELRDAGYRAVWGIEPGTQNCEKAKAEGLDVVQGDIERIHSLRDTRRMNAATLFHVIEHLPDPIGALTHVLSALPENGTVVLETPDSEAAIQKTTKHVHPLVCSEHLFYWNERSLCILFKRLGCEVRLIAHRSFNWQRVPISLSLARLGISGTRPERSPHAVSEGVPSSSSSEASQNASRTVKALVRRVLARLVHLLGRDDYLLVVAKRT